MSNCRFYDQYKPRSTALAPTSDRCARVYDLCKASSASSEPARMLTFINRAIETLDAAVTKREPVKDIRAALSHLREATGRVEHYIPRPKTSRSAWQPANIDAAASHDFNDES